MRAGVVFGTAEALKEGLTTLAEADRVGEQEPAPQTPRKVAFSFSGKPGEWVAGAGKLYESEPVFRTVLDRCEELIREERGTSLLDAMFGGRAGALESTEWSGPALYAMQCGMAALWAKRRHPAAGGGRAGCRGIRHRPGGRYPESGGRPATGGGWGNRTRPGETGIRDLSTAASS